MNNDFVKAANAEIVKPLWLHMELQVGPQHRLDFTFPSRISPQTHDLDFF